MGGRSGGSSEGPEPALESGAVVVLRVESNLRAGYRNAEYGRYAVEDGRGAVAPGLVHEMLYGKFESPMLGIHAAVLFLRQRRRDAGMLRTVLGSLSQLLPNSPDVQALRIAGQRVLESEPTALGGLGVRISRAEDPPTYGASWQ